MDSTTKTSLLLAAWFAGVVSISNCSNNEVAAISLQVQVAGKTAKILTKDGIIQCVQWFDTLPEQKWDGVVTSFINSQALKTMKVGEIKRITRTTDSTNFMIGNWLPSVHHSAIFRKDAKPIMKTYKNGGIPGKDFCEKE